MGVMNHNAVIATTWKNEAFDAIREWAIQQSETQFLFGEGTTNGERTVVLIPDGSKEGWAASAAGDGRRASFIARLQEDDYDDGSSPWCWIEVGFGEYGQKVLRGNNKNCYDEKNYADD